LNLRKLTFLVFLVFFSVVVYTTTQVSVFGVRLPPLVTPLVTLLSFFFAVLHSADRFGWKRSLLLLGLTFTVSLIFECVGVATGRIYGPYHYTDLLGPKFLGLVPLLIPAAWFMMMYPSFVISSRVIPQGWQVKTRLVGIAAVGASVMTAWDLVMDPLMVAGGYWVWEVKGTYFGIPPQNYWGWWLTALITLALFLILGGATLAKSEPHSAWFDQLAVASYLIIGLSNIIIVTSLGMGGPGLVGLFSMLPWVLMSWSMPRIPAEV
jgi:uncharacterized membrane protein